MSTIELQNYTPCAFTSDPPQAAKVAHFAIFAFLACDARAICHATETRAGGGLPRNRLILAVRQHFNYGPVAYSWPILAIRGVSHYTVSHEPSTGTSTSGSSYTGYYIPSVWTLALAPAQRRFTSYYIPSVQRQRYDPPKRSTCYYILPVQHKLDETPAIPALVFT